MSKCAATRRSRVAVAYLRASKNEQRLSREAQRAAIEAWAIREGVRVAAWCTDHGVRSVSPVAARPALCAALAALRRHGAGIFVVARRDRIARDVMLAASVEAAVSLEAARVVSVSGEGNGKARILHRIRTRHQRNCLIQMEMFSNIVFWARKRLFWIQRNIRFRCNWRTAP